MSEQSNKMDESNNEEQSKEAEEVSGMSEVLDVLESLTQHDLLKLDHSNDEETVQKINQWLQEEQSAMASPVPFVSPIHEPISVEQPLSTSQSLTPSHLSPASIASPAADHSDVCGVSQVEGTRISKQLPDHEPSQASQNEPSPLSEPSLICSNPSTPQIMQPSEPIKAEPFQASQTFPSILSVEAELAQFLNLSSISSPPQAFQVSQAEKTSKPSQYSSVLAEMSINERRSMRIKLKKKLSQEKLPETPQQLICDDDIFSLGSILNFRTPKGELLVRLSLDNQESIRQKILGFVQQFKWKKSEDSEGVKIARIKPKERTNFMLGMMRFKPKAEKKWSFSSICESRFAVIMGHFRLEVDALPAYRNIENNYAFRIPTNAKYKIINQETDSDSYLFFKISKVPK